MTIRAAAPSRLTFVCFASAALSVLATFQVAAQNWPQWRGPSGAGVSSESGLPTKWSAGENVAWKTPLAGLGTSSPIVWGDTVFVTSQIGETPVSAGSHPQLARDDRSLAERENPLGGRRPDRSGLELREVTSSSSWKRSLVLNGNRLWEYRVPATGAFSEHHEKHNLATPTPVADGERVYAWFGNGQIVALDLQGRVVWTRHLGAEYSPFKTLWGHGSSPTLYRDLLVLLCDHLGVWLPAGARQAHGKGALEGGPGGRARLTARRSWSPVLRATSSSSTPRNASTSTTRRPGSSCGTPTVRGRRRFLPPFFTTAEST